MVRTSPVDDVVYVNGDLDLQFTSSSEQIAVAIDGTLLVNLGAPFFYTWDTSTYPEGEHSVVATVPGGKSTSLTVVVDRTPPAVAARYPLAGRTNVWLEESFGFDATEPLLDTTITDASVVLTRADGSRVETTSKLTKGGEAVVLHIEKVEPSGQLTMHLTGAITDRAGNALVPEEWKFYLPAWALTGGLPAQDFDLAMSRAGIPYVMWCVTSPSGSCGVSYYVDGSWLPLGDPVSVTKAPDNIGIELDSKDRPVTALTQDGYTVVSRWEDSKWVRLGKLGDGLAFYGELTVDEGDRPVVTWGGDSALRVQALDSGGWSTSTPYTYTGYWARELRVAATSKGPFYVGVRDFDGDDCAVVAWDGTSWTQVGAKFVATDSANSCNESSLAMGPDGKLYAATGFGYSSGYGYETRLARWNGTTWEAIGTGLDGADPVDLAIGSSGTPFISLTHGYPTGGMTFTVETWDATAKKYLEITPSRSRIDLYGNDLVGIADLEQVTGMLGWNLVVHRKNAR